MVDHYQGVTAATISLALVNAAFGMEKRGLKKETDWLWSLAIWWADVHNRRNE